MNVFSPIVALRRGTSTYPKAPFHPPEQYPELPPSMFDPTNHVFGMVRDLLHDLGMDAERFGTAGWNPLGALVKPGQCVVLKPNMVFHKHPLGKEGVESMITHASVLRPLVEYVWKALAGNGEIILCDVPLQSADWHALLRHSGIEALLAYAQGVGINLRVLDLRYERSVVDKHGIVTKRVKFDGDPEGYVAVDIGTESALMPIIDQYRQLTITDYPQRAVSAHHNKQRNEYFIPKTILRADVFINVPKLKTHKKGGVTLSLKNLIGINGDKSWIAHHRSGGKGNRGDEFPMIGWWNLIKFRVFVALKYNPLGVLLLRALLPVLHGIAAMQRRIRPRTKATIVQFSGITEGSWYGNDTLWRVILDLNRILLYADKHGYLRETPQRTYFSVIDGIIGGERDGPMHHIPKRSGLLIAGTNPAYADLVATHAMGFDVTKVPQVCHCFSPSRYPLTHVLPAEVMVNDNGVTLPFAKWSQRPTQAFLPPTTWSGHLEHGYREERTATQDIPPALESSGGE